MANLVLYRKYRPQTFADIVGQENVVQTLTNAIVSEMVSHAYLFSGPRGSGKTTIARILAKAVNCQNRKKGEYEPCNKCLSCLEIAEARSIDLIEIDAASNRGIDEMRELKENIRFVPSKSKYKVFIIDEAHQLTKEAANALLKTLEEPPGHAIFILATTEIHKMISTIVSRCQRFNFRRLTVSEIIKKLEFICGKEKIKIDKEVLNFIAFNSSGSIRDAESLLDQALVWSGRDREVKIEEVKTLLGIVDLNIISQLVDFISEDRKDKAIDFLGEIIDKGKDPQEFIKTLIFYCRQLLLFKVCNDDKLNIAFTKEEKEKLKEQALVFEEEKIHYFLKLFLDAENKIKYASIPQLPLELAIIEAIEKKENNTIN
ncbi:MAG: DNA polymerase III subunit gamma/tau [Patescibacteria group bacterium]|nr:DNA polymerase III subunit gamma/tau [Patescibacteria group bacterium]